MLSLISASASLIETGPSKSNILNEFSIVSSYVHVQFYPPLVLAIIIKKHYSSHNTIIVDAPLGRAQWAFSVEVNDWRQYNIMSVHLASGWPCSTHKHDILSLHLVLSCFELWTFNMHCIICIIHVLCIVNVYSSIYYTSHHAGQLYAYRESFQYKLEIARFKIMQVK